MKEKEFVLTDDVAYRRREFTKSSWAKFILLFVAPFALLIQYFLVDLTDLYVVVLNKFVPVDHFITRKFFVWTVNLVSIDLKMPTYNEALTYLVITLILFLICVIITKKTANPIAVFFAIALFLFALNCLFFMLMPSKFYFTGDHFSTRFMQIEIITWFSMIIISALSSVLVSKTHFWLAAKLVVKTFVISYLFGMLRFILALLLLKATSAIFVTTILFFGSVLLDVIVFVFIYARFSMQVTDKFNNEEPKRWLEC